MMGKLMIAIGSCVVYGLVVSLILYITGGEAHRADWGMIGVAWIILLYSGPVFLIVGVPFSYLADLLFSEKDVNYPLIALVYIISGITLGSIIYLFFGEHLSLLKLSVYFGTAAFTLSLGLHLFDHHHRKYHLS